MSIGLESRIGLGFDKKRQNSVCGNKCCYVWEGIKKMCCATKTKKVKDIIQNVSTVDEVGNEHILFATDRKQGADRVIRKYR